MEQLKVLMDYTKFHIGVYVSLVSAAVALTRVQSSSSAFLSLKIAMVCFVIAGIAGGVIAGNIPLYHEWQDFYEARIGPWGTRLFRFRHWAHIEHTAFWIGVVSVVVELGLKR
jgi:hypothetical protein